MGGRLWIAPSGGATISRKTQEFLSTALVTILQGYGMTKSYEMCVILPSELMQYESIGVPVPSIKVKLHDIEEARYLSINDTPQGEVCICGPSVTKGYFKQPEHNEYKTIFTKDGWLRTSDVGQWNPDGHSFFNRPVSNIVDPFGNE
ncbi:hypothetical protein C0995_010097 [Termitomyces sp. Mi166|nr:hypothetical protein C0995_010097 [Termitomyces sp. Mi166\